MYQSMERRGRHWHDTVVHTGEIDLRALHQPTQIYPHVRAEHGAARIPSPAPEWPPLPEPEPEPEPGLTRTTIFPPPAHAQVPMPLTRPLPAAEVSTRRLSWSSVNPVALWKLVANKGRWRRG